MSTRISSVVAVVACLALVGCGGGGSRFATTPFGGGGGGGTTSAAPQSTEITTDRVVIAAPNGFCVDPSGTRDSGDTGFVLLGNCAAIANSRQSPQPTVPAVLTAAVSAPGAPGRIGANIGGMDAFFRSTEGRRLLSRGRDPSSVTILDTAVEGDVFLLHAADSSDGPIEGVQDEYWRAYLDIGDRIATLSVIGLEDRSLSSAQSQTTLRDFLRAVQAANFGTSDPFEPTQPPPAFDPGPSISPTPPELSPLWSIGLLRRILG